MRLLVYEIEGYFFFHSRESQNCAFALLRNFVGNHCFQCSEIMLFLFEKKLRNYSEFVGFYLFF